MGQVLHLMKSEIEKLAVDEGNHFANVDNYFQKAWENVQGREKLLQMTLDGEATLMRDFIRIVARRRCYGCIEELPSQLDHDYCLLDDDETIHQFFDLAWGLGGRVSFRSLLYIWML